MKQTPAALLLTTSAPRPPVAATRPHQVSSPHGSREDEYYWLRDDSRADPQMLDYVQAENAYADLMLAHLRPLQARLYQEIVGRLKQDDSTVPYRMNGFWYYRRFETGREYPLYARRQGTQEAPEEILLDVNAMARGHDFFEVGEIAVSPNGQMMAWAEDTIGRRQYVVRVMDLRTHQVLPVELHNVENNIAWANDETFLYIEKHPETLLGYRVRQHCISCERSGGGDPLVWEQDDDSFYTQVYRTKDDRYLLIHTQSTVSSEVWFADVSDPKLAFRVFLPRERDHEYQVEHANGRWIVRTNYRAKNFRIVAVQPGDEGDRAKWQDIVAHRDDAFVDAFDVSRDFLTIEEHSGGLRKLRIRPWDGKGDVFVTAD
jgi:oligopeptidase B